MTAPLYCPFCADEDLWPQAEPAGAWRCRGCTRAFVVTKVRTTTEQPVEHPQDLEFRQPAGLISTQENP